MHSPQRERRRGDTEPARERPAPANVQGVTDGLTWVVVVPDDYLPAVPFTVLWELDWILTARLLRGPDGVLIENRRDYDTYVVEFHYGSTPQYAVVFVPMNQGVLPGQRYVLGRGRNFVRDANGLVLTRARRIPREPVTDAATVRVDPSNDTATATGAAADEP